MTRILSLGGGLQSSTILHLIDRGLIEPVKEAVFADTGDEPDYVYEYLEYLKKTVSTKITIVKSEIASSLKDAFLTRVESKNGKFRSLVEIPFFLTVKKTGKKGILDRQCSKYFKVLPINKYLRSKYKKCEVLIGFSTDEVFRIKPSRVNYIKNTYPLIDLRWSKQTCINFYKENFIPEPKKSSCWYCPFMNGEQISSLLRDEKYYNKLVEFDNQIRDIDDKRFTYISNKYMPIDKLKNNIENEPTLFDDRDYMCDSGVCFV